MRVSKADRIQQWEGLSQGRRSSNGQALIQDSQRGNGQRALRRVGNVLQQGSYHLAPAKQEVYRPLSDPLRECLRILEEMK